jgi:hypothetical protein
MAIWYILWSFRYNFSRFGMLCRGNLATLFKNPIRSRLNQTWLSNLRRALRLPKQWKYLIQKYLIRCNEIKGFRGSQFFSAISIRIRDNFEISLSRARLCEERTKNCFAIRITKRCRNQNCKNRTATVSHTYVHTYVPTNVSESRLRNTYNFILCSYRMWWKSFFVFKSGNVPIILRFSCFYRWVT